MGISPVLWQFLVKWLNASALFPREASTIAPYMDALYFFLLGMTITGIVLVGAMIVLGTASGTDGSPPGWEKRTVAGPGSETRWAAVVRPHSAPLGVKVASAIVPRAWRARCRGELVGAERSRSWMVRAVASMSVLMSRR